MKLIAESGSTRTEWALVEDNRLIQRAFTEGLNPFFQTRREISRSVRLGLPEHFFKRKLEQVYYYGAGCTSYEKKNVLGASLVAQFKTPIQVESDLLAAARGLSAGEYYNNAVVSAPGVENAMPVGQGGKIMINGVVTNMTASLAKADKATVEGARAQAGALGGTLLNVVKVSFPGVNYHTATINFYLKGLANGAKVVVKQLVNGVWVDVEVVEVREDHVVLNLTSAGAVAFVQLP